MSRAVTGKEFRLFTVSLHDTLGSFPQLDALLELLQAQLKAAEPGQVRSALERALRPGSRAKLLLLTEAATGLPAGFAFFNVGSGLESGGDYLWLNELHVAQAFRGQGGGRALLGFLEDWARRNRVQAIYGVCGTGNHGARSFYRRMGFATEEACWFSRSIGKD